MIKVDIYKCSEWDGNEGTLWMGVAIAEDEKEAANACISVLSLNEFSFNNLVTVKKIGSTDQRGLIHEETIETW